jgi:hypothetical protein
VRNTEPAEFSRERRERIGTILIAIDEEKDEVLAPQVG